jgi:hypothetical protein
LAAQSAFKERAATTVNAPQAAAPEFCAYFDSVFQTRAKANKAAVLGHFKIEFDSLLRRTLQVLPLMNDRTLIDGVAELETQPGCLRCQVRRGWFSPEIDLKDFLI